LPQLPPAIEGLDIVARYVPMATVAGDFYDFIVVDKRRVGILVADVSGHGLPAALIASMLQVALTGQTGHAAHPAKVLSGLNRALCGKFQLNFVTAVYIYVDMAKGEVLYGGAGHPPLLLWSSATGKAGDFCENGLPLGQFPEAEYSAIPVPASPGDRVALYTDGVNEARKASGEQYGVDRIKQFLEREKGIPGGEFADKLLDELWQWSDLHSGESQTDDITLLSVQFK